MMVKDISVKLCPSVVVTFVFGLLYVSQENAAAAAANNDMPPPPPPPPRPQRDIAIRRATVRVERLSAADLERMAGPRDRGQQAVVVTEEAASNANVSV